MKNENRIITSLMDNKLKLVLQCAMICAHNQMLNSGKFVEGYNYVSYLERVYKANRTIALFATACSKDASCVAAAKELLETWFTDFVWHDVWDCCAHSVNAEFEAASSPLLFEMLPDDYTEYVSELSYSYSRITHCGCVYYVDVKVSMKPDMPMCQLQHELELVFDDTGKPAVQLKVTRLDTGDVRVKVFSY